MNNNNTLSYKRLPRKVAFELTYRCNLDCLYCFNRDIDKNKKELNTQEVFSVIEQLNDMGTTDFMISGGEPFLRKDILDILEYTKNKKFRVKLNTNASLLNKEIINSIKRMELYKVCVTLYGVDDFTYKKNTGHKNVFSKIMSNLGYFEKLKIPLDVVFLINRHTVNSIQEMKQILKKYVPKFTLQTLLYPRIDGSTSNMKTALSLEQIKKLYATEKNLLKHIKYARPDFFKFGNGEVKRITDALLCTAGEQMMYISPYGHVRACNHFYLAESKFTIRDQSLLELWNDDNNFSEIRKVKLKDVKCAKCKYLEYCNFLCPAITFTEKKAAEKGEQIPYSICDCAKTLASLYETIFPKKSDTK